MTKPIRVTVSLTPRSVERVERISKRHEDTKTDTINRAIALYDMLETMQDEGRFLYTKTAGGEWERMVLVK